MVVVEAVNSVVAALVVVDALVVVSEPPNVVVSSYHSVVVVSYSYFSSHLTVQPLSDQSSCFPMQAFACLSFAEVKILWL